VARGPAAHLFCHEERGPEPTLLLVHGFPFDGRMWEPQVEALRGRFRLLAPDLWGFGRSAPPHHPPSIESQAEGLEWMLSDLGVARAVLCGFSMGGYVGLAFAARFPERLSGLVLADTRAGADSAEGRATRTESARRALREGPGFLADTMPEKLLSKMTFDSRLGLVGRIQTLIRDQPREGVAAALLAMRDRPDRSAELGRVTCPTLVLCGAEDAISPPAEMRAMADAIPGARYAEIPGAGHLSNIENPNAFNRELMAFLSLILEGYFVGKS
jgi:pimeloyl-ACP methyl ester carboxylesterase